MKRKKENWSACKSVDMNEIDTNNIRESYIFNEIFSLNRFGQIIHSVGNTLLNVRIAFFTELLPLFSENSKCYFRWASIYKFFVKLTVPFKNVCFKIDFRLTNFGI